MEFGFTSEQDMLRKSFSEFLAKECPSDIVRELIEDDVGFSPDIWKKISELGWLGLIYDEKYGGSEGAFLELFILFEEIGKVLLPSPLFTSAVLSGLLIHEAGNEKQKDDLLPSLINGSKIFTLSLYDEQGKLDIDNPKVEAVENQNGSYTLNGNRLFVTYAHLADSILLCAKLKGSKTDGSTLFRIPGNADGIQKDPLNTITGEKTFALILNNTEVQSENVIGSMGKGADYLNCIFPKAVVLKCGEMLGGLQRIFDMTIAYVKERHQFGRPLGSLQAVQHFCVDMNTYLETSRLISYQAASLISEGVSCEKEVAMAKAWCSDAYKKSTWIAQQIHGGIGFTEEYDLHLFYKHAKEAELAFGDSWFHRSRIADNMGI